MSEHRRSNPPDIADTYSLLVLNLTFRTTVEDLYPLFDPYGRVVDIHIPRDRTTGQSRGFAFVRYKYEEEADEAIERLDGMKFDGRYIKVQYAKYGPNAERIQRGRIGADARSRRRSPARRNRYRDRSRSPPRLSSYRDRADGRLGNGRDNHERHELHQERDRDRDYRRRSRSRSFRDRGRDMSRSSSRSRSNSATKRISRRRSRAQRSSPSTQGSTTSLSASEHAVEATLSASEHPVEATLSASKTP